MYKKIGDYGIIGNLRTIALIGIDGSMDWLCLPNIDSPSVFGALLDDRKGGRFSISPVDAWDSVAEYVPGTNILKTMFRTKTGIMQLTDFMPVSEKREDVHSGKRHTLYRLIEILKGRVKVGMVFEPGFDYARTGAVFEHHKKKIVARGNKEILCVLCTHELNMIQNSTDAGWDLPEGEKLWIGFKYGEEAPDELDRETAAKALQDTEAYWRNWLKKSETGKTVNLRHYKGMVERSALVLKLLYYEPTGTIAAAATTSLPEEVGGVRNWDYRYTWVRDTSFTLQALFNLGHLSETEGYLRWVKLLLSEHGAGKMRIMYSIRGEEELHEEELGHLDGYKGSKPVRIGNKAALQRQLDIYGELMDAALKLSDYVGKIDSELWHLLRGICNYVIEHWKDRDSGIWESRGGAYHFVYSKVMCWLALDRGIIIARRYGFPAAIELWEKAAAEIKSEILEKGWSEKKKAFVQHYETDALDSSNLLLPILGFLPFDDPRVVSTVEAIGRELGHDGFLYRYKGDDGLPGAEGTFLLCTFWLIDNLIALGKLDEAEMLIHKMEGAANHLGLFSEEYDAEWKEPLGNFPQAFTHIGYINSVIALCMAKEKTARGPKEIQTRKIAFPACRIALNDGEPRQDIHPADIGSRLKTSMNILRGAFFDTKNGRVAYERMKNSEAYAEYLQLSYALRNMDISELKTGKEKIAFWINLYNVIVIHGVIELGVRDSVKEVMNFFRRIRYLIGGMHFSPEDIEHGILRGNRRPPRSIFRMFGKNDRRLNLSIEPIDPRIHFGLVCASSSCPPIDFYTPEKLDEELDIAGRTFLNAGGIKIDRDMKRVSLSRIFYWYADDFGQSLAERLRFIAQFLYDEDRRNFLMENAGALKVDHQKYDWRLNRY